MKTIVHHNAPFRTIVNIGLMIILVLGTLQVARADKSRKVVDRNAAKQTTDQVIKAASPSMGAVDVIVSAMRSKSAKTTGQQPKIKVTSDTARRETRILFATVTADVFKTRVDIGSDQQQIDIGIFNMLGKRMGDIYAGPASRGEHEYTMSVSDFPEGVYICILQGSNFRRAEKFYLNR